MKDHNLEKIGEAGLGRGHGAIKVHHNHTCFNFVFETVSLWMAGVEDRRYNLGWGGEGEMRSGGS